MCRSHACSVAVLLPGGPPHSFFDPQFSGPLVRISCASELSPTYPSVTNNLFASVLDANVLTLTPSHSTSHTAPVLEQIELYQADLVTTARLDELVRAGICQPG